MFTFLRKYPPSVLTTSFNTINLLRHPVHALNYCYYRYNNNSFTHEIVRHNGTVLFGSRDISVVLPLTTVNFNWSQISVCFVINPRRCVE